MHRAPRFVTPVLAFSFFIKYRFRLLFNMEAVWTNLKNMKKSKNSLNVRLRTGSDRYCRVIHRARARVSRVEISIGRRVVANGPGRDSGVERTVHGDIDHGTSRADWPQSPVPRPPGAAGPPPCTLFSTSSFAKRREFFLPSTRPLFCGRVVDVLTPISDVGSSFAFHGSTCTSGENETSCSDGEIQSKVR